MEETSASQEYRFVTYSLPCNVKGFVNTRKLISGPQKSRMEHLLLIIYSAEVRKRAIVIYIDGFRNQNCRKVSVTLKASIANKHNKGAKFSYSVILHTLSFFVFSRIGEILSVRHRDTGRLT